MHPSKVRSVEGEPSESPVPGSKGYLTWPGWTIENINGIVYSFGIKGMGIRLDISCGQSIFPECPGNNVGLCSHVNADIFDSTRTIPPRVQYLSPINRLQLRRTAYPSPTPVN